MEKEVKATKLITRIVTVITIRVDRKLLRFRFLLAIEKNATAALLKTIFFSEDLSFTKLGNIISEKKIPTKETIIALRKEVKLTILIPG